MQAVYSKYAPSFLYVDKYLFSQKWVYQESKVPYSMFRYVYRGSAIFEVDHQKYTVTPNTLFYIPEGSMLSCQALEEIVFISVRFTGSVQLPGQDMLKNLWNITQQYDCTDMLEIGNWFERIYQAAVSDATYKRLEIRGYLNLICLQFAKRSHTGEASTMERDWATLASAMDMDYVRERVYASRRGINPSIQMLVDYIKLHPEENITREKMCRMIGMGESTLRRVFKAEMGKSIHEFIADVKMMYAVHLLVTTVDTISEIGYQLGYESPSYFTKLFRERMGVSPQMYRKTSKET